MRIVICIAKQTLTHITAQGEKIYSVSTGLKGVGQLQGSNQTPLGAHFIRAKIGGDCPLGAVFVGRRWTGEVYSPELAVANPGRDWILSRILWLCGSELGVNRGGQVDTQRRYIYIHGTPYDEQIGQAASQGCIRMRNADIIELYNQIEVGLAVNLVLN